MSEETFADFEERWHFRLPESYKDFARLFGPGILGGGKIAIAAPGKLDIKTLDLDAVQNHGPVMRMAAGVGHEDPRHVCRLIYFAENPENDSFGWDPWEITDPKQNECRIYRAAYSENHLRKFARTFEDFIRATGIYSGRGRDVFKFGKAEKKFSPAC